MSQMRMTVSAPSHDHALQQVILLKRELAELKAQQTLNTGHNGVNTALLQVNL